MLYTTVCGVCDSHVTILCDNCVLQVRVQKSTLQCKITMQESVCIIYSTMVEKNKETEWEKVQEQMKALVICNDSEFIVENGVHLVGGTDLSFVKESPNKACAALIVCKLPTFEVVYEDIRMVTLDVPYKAGFLAFREVPPLKEAVERIRNTASHFTPEIILVDGNGILHPKGFGLASHLGVMCDIPTIGVAKNLHHVYGLMRDYTHRKQISDLKEIGDRFPLVSKSGKVLGMALKTSAKAVRPVYVSVGHKIALDTAVKIVLQCSKFKNPEPVRQADMRSREYIRKYKP